MSSYIDDLLARIHPLGTGDDADSNRAVVEVGHALEVIECAERRQELTPDLNHYFCSLPPEAREELLARGVAARKEHRETLWAQVVALYKHRQLYTADVADVLRAGYAPTFDALPVIADILTNQGQPLKCTGRPKTDIRDGRIVRVVGEVAGEYLKAARDAGKGKQASKEWVAVKLGLSDGTVKAVARTIEMGKE